MSSRETVAQAFAKACSLNAPLDGRLAQFVESYRTLCPEISEAYDRLIDRLEAAHPGKQTPDVGQPMPAFHLPDHDGRLVSLEELLASDQIVVSFNRGHWCEHCKLELVSLAENASDIAERGGRIVSIVPDNRKFVRELRAELNLPFSVLSDLDTAYAMSLDLAIWVGREVNDLYSQIGMDPLEVQGNSNWLLPIPATFVVGQDGRIKARFVDPNFRNRMAIDDILRALGAD